MGKLINKKILQARPPSLQVKQLAGWSWYCGYHDTMGSGDTRHEVLWMAGAHMNYFSEVTDDCDIYVREHEVEKENDGQATSNRNKTSSKATRS
jgi:hypothetical protein